MEHQFTIPEIAAFIKAENLQFLGFELAADVVESFEKQYPNRPFDLDFGTLSNSTTTAPFDACISLCSKQIFQIDGIKLDEPRCDVSQRLPHQCKRYLQVIWLALSALGH